MACPVAEFHSVTMPSRCCSRAHRRARERDVERRRRLPVELVRASPVSMFHSVTPSVAPAAASNARSGLTATLNTRRRPSRPEARRGPRPVAPPESHPAVATAATTSPAREHDGVRAAATAAVSATGSRDRQWSRSSPTPSLPDDRDEIAVGVHGDVVTGPPVLGRSRSRRCPTSHNRSVPSSSPVTSRPSGRNATPKTGPSCPTTRPRPDRRRGDAHGSLFVAHGRDAPPSASTATP